VHSNLIFSQENYQKTGKKFSSFSDVLEQATDGASYFSQYFPTDKADRHNYTKYYDILLKPYQSYDISILEIGVKKGGSLKMWREYFSDGSSIYGIDIDPGIPTFPRDSKIKTLAFDSRDPEILKNALKGTTFDIIVDDGDHSPLGQIATLKNLYTFLKPTGIYIVEDVLPFFSTDNLKFLEEISTKISWSRHADSTEETIIFIYPKNSIAEVPKMGLVSAKTLGHV